MSLSSKIIAILLLIFMFNAFDPVFAAQVAAVKDKKVLVIGDNLEAGGLYYVVSQGKKKGIIKVLKLKGRKGLATLLKGTANKGFSLVYRPRKSKGSSGSQQATRSRPSKSSSEKNYDMYSEEPSSTYSSQSKYGKANKKSLGVGLMLGYGQNSAKVTFNGGGSDSLSGSGIGFKVFGDYPLYDSFYLRGEFGTIPFQAEGSNKCSGTCTMAINYLGASLWGRYMLGNSTSKTRFWGGVGASLIFPLDTGDTNAVDADGVGSTLIFGLGGGLDYKINDKYYIPLSVQYSLFPPSDDVSANMIIVKAGLGMKL